MALGGLKVKGIGFDTAGGLFAGIPSPRTSPPADTPTVAYATVYRSTTLLRILSAQVLAITPFR